MNRVAIKMLMGDGSKYCGIIFGIAFASLLISQQASIFWGLMNLTTSQVKDIQGQIWVMDPGVQFVDDIKPMSENELFRVRGVKGVQWAVKLYKGLTRARLEDGTFKQIILLGLDDSTLVGAPAQVTAGRLEDLRQPDAVIMDERGFRDLWPGEKFSPGKTFEMNDRRAVLVGLCIASKTFATFPIVYTRYSQATRFVPQERKVLSFILAQADPDRDPLAVCQEIERQTGLKALTREGFAWATIEYYLRRTGIPFNFFITVLLGFFVGTAISGQTFYLFTVDNLRQFGALKAMGLGNLRLVGMIVLQSLVVGLIGYGLGLGGAALFGKLAERVDKLAFLMTWQILAVTGGAVVVMMIFTSLLSIYRVVVLEPAIVFRN